MSLKTQWLNAENTRTLLDVSDRTLKELRKDNVVISTTLEGKLHYRLDTLLEHLQITSCVTYEDVSLIRTEVEPAMEATAVETVKEMEEVEDDEKAPWEEQDEPTLEEKIEKNKQVVFPWDKAKEEEEIEFKGKASTVYLYHYSRPYADLGVEVEDVPCFHYRNSKKDNIIKKTIEGYLVDIALFRTTKAAEGARLKVVLTFRSAKNPAVIMQLPIYPLMYLPGKVLTTFLNNFEAGRHLLFENLGTAENLRYQLSSVVDNDLVLINEWSKRSYYEEELTEKEAIVLISMVKNTLIRTNKLEELYDPTKDRDFDSNVKLHLEAAPKPMEDGTF